MRKYLKFVLLMAIIIASCLLLGDKLIQYAIINVTRLQVIQDWVSWEKMDVGNGVGLKDGIPDGWEILSWGDARALYYLAEEITPTRSRAAVIERSNQLGGAAFIQMHKIEPGAQIHVSVSAKGDEGALQVQFRRDERDEWQGGGWKDIGITTTWSSYLFSIMVPPDMTELRLLLRSSRGIIQFDSVYLGIETQGSLGPNLVFNPEFEQDGIDRDPLSWWEKQAENIQPIRIPSNLLNESNLAFLNIVDMSNGNYDSIKLRAQKLGDQCASMPEFTGWLLSLGQEDSAILKERYYLLAIELAPNCPQPYAALAELYASRSAYKSAADLYHIAYDLSGGSLLAGRYAFEAGLIHFRYTGKIDDAISLFIKASDESGWERGSWYRGAASFYLGLAYEIKDMDLEAKRSFLRVVECKNCTSHHVEAAAHLESLVLSQSEP